MASSAGDQQEAGKRRFLTKMQNGAFVTRMLRDAGIERPPCFCCLQQVNKTCVRAVGEPDCPNYVLYSASPEKVERKLLVYIEEQWRNKATA